MMFGQSLEACCDRIYCKGPLSRLLLKQSHHAAPVPLTKTSVTCHLLLVIILFDLPQSAVLTNGKLEINSGKN